MKKKLGKVIIPASADPWPHEEHAAKILAQHGYIVEFIPKHNSISSADVYLDGVEYEMKSPTSNKSNTIEHRLKDATDYQSRNIILDASRIKNKPDYSLKNFLINKMRTQKQIKNLLLITKQGKVIDIKKLLR